MIPPDLDRPLPDTAGAEHLGAVHLVGIGGSGMSGLARMFLAAGHRVSGSDRSDSATIAALRELGIPVTIGHDAANLGDADTVVVTGALWEDNPEYRAARERGLTVLHRANALAALVGDERLVAVAGAHGKTTSTGMVVSALVALGADPSFVNGGVIAGLRVSARPGRDPLFVIEADESDRSFLLFRPTIALLTNIDDDHLESYGGPTAFEDAFVEFAGRSREAVVASADDPAVAAVLARLAVPRIRTFGLSEHADLRVHDVDASPDGVAFRITIDGATHAARLAVAGPHNALNAAGALGVLLELGYPVEESLRALEGFTGTGRRFEPHGEAHGVRVFDDYAHHPAEVEAALRTARSVVGAGRVIAVHQPHLYSRTQRLAGEFAEVYERLADHTVVLDVYGAREDPIPGVTGALVAERFADPEHVAYRPDWQEAADHVAEVARPGDLVMTLSCGDVYRIIPQLLDALEHGPGAEAGAGPGTGAARS
ncbi:MAG: UDP-N-acetylmuramate--L-alanine ligase [Actinomycetales bacterium]|nr:UDP-N-acetylmuramate--L-alanine ligase [Actinomycetales bacterium]